MAKMENGCRGKKHALVLPITMQAHIAGILRLCTDLATRGVAISFVAGAREVAVLKENEELRELDFHLISYEDFAPSGGSEQLHEKFNNPFEFIAVAQKVFDPVLEKLVADQRAGLPGPTCLISDRLLAFAQDVANELNIPHYQFYSCGAHFVRILQEYPKLLADGTLKLHEDFRTGKVSIAEYEGHLNIAGLPPLRWKEILNPIKLGLQMFLDVADRIDEVDGLIVNTFYEMDAPQVDAIRQRWEGDPQGKTRQLFLVGPLSNAANFKDQSFVSDSSRPGHDCLQWLDSRQPDSVLYICFGSLVRFTIEQIHELAIALEASGHDFLWVLSRGFSGKPFSDLDEILPPNFRSRTRDRGLILDGWVPQLHVLSHPSTGGFVTHCGWNSAIEGVTTGVPMIAWPQLPNDQGTVCRHLVDELKIAVEVGGSGKFNFLYDAEIQSVVRNLVGREELEDAVRFLLSEQGNDMRARVRELKKRADAAVAEGGARGKAMDDIVQSIPTHN
ncbi:protein MpUGT38 [Marchantia polymorpha subsp. ruderalis]|uniref:Glycosyltransferase n=1 Tax=Marchantia polymorpha TaxID=3197 RepID=A0A2R6WCK7_MARPO|nr:hypothetical protein MARPO_0109s0002 [Marchantia polymorpha]BBN20781.1 hypothetical protein Mp_zg01360 [Marchantia polymorpha subsp. ruderalis]|eukprot:PTQ31567.1 hypothetical protein MARPO_0109s0002 [Marchantia polymorpha]